MNAINSIQNVLDNITDLDDIATRETLKNITAQYNTEVIKLATSQMVLTKEQATAIFTAKGLSGAELDAAVKTSALATAETVATGTTTGLATAFKGLGVALKTNPLFGAAAGVFALFGIIKAIDYFASATERAKESALDASKAFKEADDTLKSLNSELETTRSRIEELESQPNLTFIEQEELDKLKEAADQLERQIVAQEKLQEKSLADARKDTLDYFNKKSTYDTYMGLEDMPAEYGQSPYKIADYETVQYAPLEMLQYQLDKYEGLINRRKELDGKLSAIEKDGKEGYESSSEYVDLKTDLSAVTAELGNLDEIIPTAILDLQNLDDTLNPETDNAFLEKIQNIYKAYDSMFGNSSETKTKKFNDIWNSNEFSKQRKEIEALATAGELKPEVLETTEEYKRLIDETGASAESVAENINALVDAESGLGRGRQSSLSYADTIAELEKLSDAFSAMDSAYAKFIDKDKSIGFEDLAELNKQFKDVSGIENYIKAIQDAGGETEATQIAFDNLLSAYLEQTGILDQVNEKNAQLIEDYLTEQGVANATALVEAQLSVSRNEMALSAIAATNATYGELSALRDEIATTDEAKFAINQFYLEKITANGISLATDGDIKNIMALVEACGGGVTALKALADARQGIFDSLSQTAMPTNWQDRSPLGQAMVKADLESKMAEYKKQEDQLLSNANAEIAAVLNKTYSGSNGNYSGAKNDSKSKGGSGGGKGSSKEDTKKDFDWIDRKLQLLEDKRAELEEKASSSALSYLGLSESDMAKAQELLEKFGSQATLTGNDITSLGDLASKTGMFIGDFIDVLKNNGLDSRQGYLSQQLEIEKEILAERQKATQQYLAKYEETVSKLPDDLRQKVANGGDDIETLTGDEATYAQEAIDARDKYLESLENEDQAKQNLIETTKKGYELELEYLDQQASRLNHQNTMIEKQIDLLNASGQMVNVSSYEQILANMRRQEEILNKKIAQKRKEMQALLESGYIEEDSEEYFQMQQYIESCEESLVDLAIEQEEYNDKIRQLPIENMQKVINMYEDISNALRDYANVMEASGKKLDAEYFQMQIANGKETIAQYKEQADLIRDVMSEYEVGSDKYMEMYDKLQDINSSISSIVQNMHEWNKELISLPINAMNDKLTGLNDALSAFQQVQNDHETVIQAVTSAINEQIKVLEEKRDLEVEAAQKEIDALQDQLDLLHKQNEARKIQLALDQAKYNLERARNQKTNQVNKLPDTIVI